MEKINFNEVYGEKDDWIKAGKIAAEALQYGKSLIKVDASYLEVLNKIEEKIKSLGANLGFPAQISFNEIAAHECANPNDNRKFKEGDIVKLDLGTSVNGAIGDTALTVDLGNNNQELTIASKKALENAIKIIKPGITLSEIGKTIQETIESYGFNPIKNLSGHGLAKYNIHTKPSVPNFDNNDNYKLKENQIIAIEPFATNGVGLVIEEKLKNNLYMKIANKGVRSIYARKIMPIINSFNGLPFTTRHLTQKFSLPKVKFALREMETKKIINPFPPLKEKSSGLVSQHEHSLIVKDKPIILTKL